MSMFKWEVVDPGPGEAVAPHQRLGWGKTVGLGAQHVVAMFGATFVFPLTWNCCTNTPETTPSLVPSMSPSPCTTPNRPTSDVPLST